MPSRLANLLPEPPEKRNIGLRHLLTREFESHLLIIAQALAIAKTSAADEHQLGVQPVNKLSFHMSASGGNIRHLRIKSNIEFLY